MERRKVFIDGSAGTTGLRIRERLSARGDIELIPIPDELRKDPAVVTECLRAADVAFLCLPDAAAREAVGYVTDGAGVPVADAPVIIDTSTAHRTAPGWVYGFPELVGREAVAQARLIANPGCHASGFVALVAPLVRAGLVRADAQLSCFSLTGYSGGGKAMIAQYDAAGFGGADAEGAAAAADTAHVRGATGNPADALLAAPRLYGLGQEHKHLAEMRVICGLDAAPVFCPIVAPYYAGMEVVVPFTADVAVAGTLPGCNDVRAVYRAAYADGLVRVADDLVAEEGGFLSAGAFAGFDDMQVGVCGNADRLLLIARFDNLGKGASGAAIQNMNIVLGTDEKAGLQIHG